MNGKKYFALALALATAALATPLHAGSAPDDGPAPAWDEGLRELERALDKTLLGVGDRLSAMAVRGTGIAEYDASAPSLALAISWSIATADTNAFIDLDQARLLCMATVNLVRHRLGVDLAGEPVRIPKWLGEQFGIETDPPLYRLLGGAGVDADALNGMTHFKIRAEYYVAAERLTDYLHCTAPLVGDGLTFKRTVHDAAADPTFEY